MSQRWHMNRMGFVNFWLYDEETFTLADGKLLLRGQNGSGKSITTQSFIPFILDGDRTPSRLDPFGSGDRRMDYYFLGENDREEATGYLFPEFKREGVEQYRTIGIGQRAVRGKSITFWGFVILDGRRVGLDLSLYREIGASRIPLTKKELRESLGEGNLYTESQREYAEMVNRYLFGFTSTEQYSQFIRLLVKVRAPKLSKEFKPTKVYEILNDSLQTLSDEDMRAMVEAMEKMDEIQERLDHLRAAFQDVKAIRNEYLRYNLYMLGKKGQAYTEERRKVERARKELESRETAREEKSGQIRSLEEAQRTRTGERGVLQAERETLRVEELDAVVETLRTAEREWEEQEREKKSLEEMIRDCQTELVQRDHALRGLRDAVEELQTQTDQLREELYEENEILMLPFHGQTERMAKTGETGGFGEVHTALREWERSVREALEALQEQARCQKALESEEEKLHEVRTAAETASDACREAERMEAEARDNLVEEFYVLETENREMGITREERERMTRGVQNCQSYADSARIRDEYEAIVRGKSEILSRKVMKLRTREEEQAQERKRLAEELEALRNLPMPAPVHSDRVEQARHALREQNIPFLPFYEALDFAEDVTPEKRNQIEGQLLDAGLLDALVVPEAEQEQVREALAGLSDVLIRPVGKAGTPYPFLRAAAEEPALRQETERILCCLREMRQEADEGTETILGSDGYFRNGVLEGYSHAEEEAAYVGAAARRRTKERWIREKEAELRAKEESLTELRKEIRGLEDRLARLEQERDRFPSFDSLHTAIGLREESERERERCLREVRAQEEKVTMVREASTEAGQRVLRCCKPLPYTRKTAYYKEVIDTITEYRDSLISLRDVLGNLEIRRNDCAREEDKIQSLEEKREEREWSRRRAEQSMRELQVKMDRLRQTLEAPEMQERTRRLREINRRLEEIEAGERESEKQLAVLRDNVERLSGEIEAQKEVLTEAVSRENLVRRYFEEELRLGLVMRPGEYSLNEAAVKAQTQIRETDRNRHASEVTSSLMRNFQAHLGTLSGYGTTMEPCFEEAEDDTLLRRREQIVSVWNGKKLYLEEFYTVLREAIDSTELLIQEEDRKLFEGILADTLSRKLSQRIRESRNWIRDMSALMREMDTSMGLTFSLDWRPRTAEGEGELDTQELERILARERENSSRMRISRRFRYISGAGSIWHGRLRGRTARIRTIWSWCGMLWITGNGLSSI